MAPPGRAMHPGRDPAGSGGGARGVAQDRDRARRVLEVLLAEVSLAQAVALAARITGVKKNALYALALAMRKRDE